MALEPARAQIEEAAASVLGSGISWPFPRDELRIDYLQQVVDEWLEKSGHTGMLLVKETDTSVVITRSPEWAGTGPEEGFRH